MSNVTAIPGINVKPSDFWVTSGLLAQNETLDGLVSQVGSLVGGFGDSTSIFKELTFDVGDLTYHYVGDWALNILGNGLTSTTTASGSYHQVLIEKAGQIIEQLDLDKPLDVLFGEHSGLSLLGINLGDIVNPILKTLLGDGVDLNVANLHLGVNPDLKNLVEIGGPVSTGDPTEGDDVLIGTPQSDTIDGLGGNDKIYGLASADVLHGGTGNDSIWGQGGNDKIFGDAGTDTIWSAGGKDVVHVGTGNDTVFGGGGKDKLFGDAGSDILHGAAGNDRLVGGGGAEKLFGDGGRDVLVGGGGKDMLVGGMGHDMLSGGKGADIFDFNLLGESSAKKGGSDTIMDFSHGQNDKIDLSSIDVDLRAAGDQQFDFVGNRAFDHSIGQVRTAESNGSTVVQADLNGDGKADFSILLDHATNIQANDFIL